jgi:glycosyltransferase involved in cell wall biosynthesis
VSTPSPLPVTVVIAAYNRPAMTRQAVLSALGQRPHPPAEVLVVDDCSTDDTGRAAEEAGARVIRHERNQGEGGARNTAVAAATQPWLAMLDSDDEWLPWHLQTLWPLRDGHVVVAGSALYCSENGSFRYQGLPGRGPRTLRSPAALLYPFNFLPLSATMARTELVRQVGGFDPALRWGADLDLWLRVLEHGSGVMSARPVLRYRVHEGQVIQDRESAARAHLGILQRYAERPWWSATRVEAWRGGAAWDQLRRDLAAGRRDHALRTAAFASRHPARAAGLVGLLARRFAMRRRTARLRAAGWTAD